MIWCRLWEIDPGPRFPPGSNVLLVSEWWFVGGGVLQLVALGHLDGVQGGCSRLLIVRSAVWKSLGQGIGVGPMRGVRAGRRTGSGSEDLIVGRYYGRQQVAQQPSDGVGLHTRTGHRHFVPVGDGGLRRRVEVRDRSAATVVCNRPAGHARAGLPSPARARRTPTPTAADSSQRDVLYKQ